MAKVKSRGNDAPQFNQSEETKVDIRRLANIGKTIELNCGEITVKEPSLEKVVSILNDLLPFANNYVIWIRHLTLTS